MSFDRTNQAHLTALRSEVFTDPIGMGYVANGPTAALLDLLNNPSKNVGGQTINRPVDELQIPELSAVIDPTEYSALSAYDKEWVKMFITRPSDEQLKMYQAKILQLFNAQSTTRAAFLALRVKAASRAEILFGVNTVISGPDWFMARG